MPPLLQITFSIACVNNSAIPKENRQDVCHTLLSDSRKGFTDSHVQNAIVLFNKRAHLDYEIPDNVVILKTKYIYLRLRFPLRWSGINSMLRLQGFASMASHIYRLQICNFKRNSQLYKYISSRWCPMHRYSFTDSSPLEPSLHNTYWLTSRAIATQSEYNKQLTPFKNEWYGMSSDRLGRIERFLTKYFWYFSVRFSTTWSWSESSTLDRIFVTSAFTGSVNLVWGSNRRRNVEVFGRFSRTSRAMTFDKRRLSILLTSPGASLVNWAWKRMYCWNTTVELQWEFVPFDRVKPTT